MKRPVHEEASVCATALPRDDKEKHAAIGKQTDSETTEEERQKTDRLTKV
jgi:hypothetical protein